MHTILYYNNLDYYGLEAKFNKLIEFLRNGDFKSAEVKKLQPTEYFSARLDITNRLLFKPMTYKNQHYLLILEVIRNHEYDKSRFLQGSKIIEEHIRFDTEALSSESFTVPSSAASVHLLNKFIVFDKRQEDILSCNLPLMITGSAGSGKTSVTLEKLKSLEGKILYISLSSYLVQNAQKLYFSFNYRNDKQDLDFLSFKEFLETTEIPKGRQINVGIFLQWFKKRYCPKDIADGRKLFEEFTGVITGSTVDKAYLTREEYLNLGIKQSIFLEAQRNNVYDLFEKYIEFLSKENYYDNNIISYDYMNLVDVIYDAVVVDEVQDFTNRQLSLVLRSLKESGRFLLCGDANQIVHPNFFSWSKLKSLLYCDADLQTDNITRILVTNYRNSPEVTELANRVLRFKNYRFGSIDKESYYLIESVSEKKGIVSCLEANSDIIKDINAKTSRSTSYAILVLHDHDKLKAQEYFNSPLIFTVQEAKGLEYENIILYNFVSDEAKYMEMSRDMDQSFLDADFRYSRAKDKTDKAIEIYKFYINALYVAVTRSICNVYMLESNPAHKFLRLLDIQQIKDANIRAVESTGEEWQKEAAKLAMQGKEEQAKAIEAAILKYQEISQPPINKPELAKLASSVFDHKTANKKDIIKLLHYAVIYSDSSLLEKLRAIGLKAAGNIAKSILIMQEELFSDYLYKSTNGMLQKIAKFGVDFRNEFNLTPLMCAAYVGKKPHVEKLISLGASITAVDNNNRNAFMIAVSRAKDDTKYCQGLFNDIYEFLKPSAIIVNTNNKLVKIESHKAEYFFLYFLLTIVRNVTDTGNGSYNIAFRADNISRALQDFPINILPEQYKNREYIGRLFIRNEVNSNYPYNKRLFTRIARGFYGLNPRLKVKINDSFENP